MTIQATAALLLAGHILLDFPLQGEYLARGKNPNTPWEGVPWSLLLTYHAALHGLCVYLITGHIRMGLIEFALHWYIDYSKYQNQINFVIDQALHLLIKLAFVVWMLPL
jgi:hypothetical protein